MRLNPFDTNKINVGSTGGGGVGKAGGLGCGTIILAALGYFVFGLDPFQTAATVENMQGSQTSQSTGVQDEQAICTSNEYATETCNALTSLNETWEQVFREQGFGEQFQQPGLWFASGRFNTGCGAASSGMGPFYCPADQRIYIDTSFYDQLAQMAGNSGDFARYYVVAHEYGHHVQTITGISDQIRSQQQRVSGVEANQLQVRMELQADCYAGVWAGRNRNLIEPGDLEEGMEAAAAIGDDTLTKGRVSPENFTHGTSAQRMQALRLGLQGDDKACDAITNIS
jgi:hypothetical protein